MQEPEEYYVESHPQSLASKIGAPPRNPSIPRKETSAQLPVEGAVGRVKQTPPAWDPTLDSRFRGNDGGGRGNDGVVGAGMTVMH